MKPLSHQRYIIYLDFDGVIYPYASSHRRLGLQASGDAVAAINWLVEMYRAQIVLSTTWRYTHTLDELRARLRGHGIKGEVIGGTPMVYQSRDVEISADLQARPGVVGIVLDDDDDVRLLAKSEVANRCVVAHCSGKTGLRLREAMKAARMLSNSSSVLCSRI